MKMSMNAGILDSKFIRKVFAMHASGEMRLVSLCIQRSCDYLCNWDL